MKKKTKIIISIVAIVILSVTVISVIYYNKQFVTDKYYFTVDKERYIEVPGRCKVLDRPFSGFKFLTDKSVDEVLEFYDNYLKDKPQMESYVGYGYYIESADIVILDYEAIESNGKTYFMIDYDLPVEDEE